ncbi:MAG: YceI family protein [Pseudomonadota bacterium]
MQKHYQVIAVICAILAVVSCLPEKQAQPKSQQNSVAEPTSNKIPSGTYKLDLSHASLIFRVNHLGFSNYTARFKNFDANLQFDPQNPTKANIAAVIDPASIETDYPDAKKHDFNAQLRGENWLNVVRFPKIIFRSQKIIMTGEKTADIVGELDLHGIKKPLILKATFNGGYASHPMDPSGSRIGFSAHGSLQRSDFGIKYGIPAAGSNMGVGDNVEFIIEAEFTLANNQK